VACFAQGKPITAPIMGVYLTVDQSIFLHPPDHARRVALCAEQQITQENVIDSWVVLNMHKYIKTRNIQAVSTEKCLLVIVDMEKNRLKRFIQLEFGLLH